MPKLNLNGKYWNMQDLEKELSRSAHSLYPILKSLTGVIRIGYVFLVPDYLMPIIRHKVNFSSSYTISTAAAALQIGRNLMREFVACGLPVFKNDGEVRILKAHIPALHNAISVIRKKHGNFNKSHVPEALKMAMAEIECGNHD